MVWRNWYTVLHTISSILWMVRCSFHNVISTCIARRGNLAEDLMYVAADAAKVERSVLFT